MRLLTDECLPRNLKRLLGPHDCRTVQEMGWSSRKNGELLSLAQGNFDVLLTADQGMEYEQRLTDRKIAVLVFVARSNQIEDLTPVVPAALAALRDILPGRMVRVKK